MKWIRKREKIENGKQEAQTQRERYKGTRKISTKLRFQQISNFLCPHQDYKHGH